MTIEEAGEGREALEKVHDFDPDIIFMDIKLPGESGLQVSRRIRHFNPEAKIIRRSSFSRATISQSIERLREMGALIILFQKALPKLKRYWHWSRPSYPRRNKEAIWKIKDFSPKNKVSPY
jgi:CheY-like chemotaxis protein